MHDMMILIGTPKLATVKSEHNFRFQPSKQLIIRCIQGGDDQIFVVVHELEYLTTDFGFIKPPLNPSTNNGFWKLIEDRS